MNMFGIDNVIDCEAIIGKSGVADGFNVFYTRKVGKKDRVCRKTVWVREPEAVVDGSIHGFGKGVPLSRKVKRVKKPTLIKVDNVSEILKKIRSGK